MFSRLYGYSCQNIYGHVLLYKQFWTAPDVLLQGAEYKRPPSNTRMAPDDHCSGMPSGRLANTSLDFHSIPGPAQAQDPQGVPMRKYRFDAIAIN